ncbi:MAG: acyltransferase family protein [Acidobacteria bacterium]|nr:acyltransferase family protein [Acidobacteriota bacterium]
MQLAPRYHAFDALRGSMMLLGIVIHSAAAYCTFPDVWWLKDPSTSRFIDLLMLFVHSFRLPAFFVMSGFFAALLFSRRGWQGFLENRAARLGLPFLLGSLAMFPFLKISSVYCYFLTRDPRPWQRTLSWLGQGRLESDIEPMHLWFLETLMLVSLAAALLGPWLSRVLSRPWFASFLSPWVGIPACSFLTFLTLLPMEFGILDTPDNFAPYFRIVLAYSVFFAFGWGLYCHREMLDRLKAAPAALFALAAILIIPTSMAIAPQFAARPLRHWPAFLATATLTSAVAWLMIFALIGLFLRRCSDPSPRTRYLSDSAYWLYLFHPPVLVAIQIPMLGLAWPVAVKFLIGILLATPVLLYSYDLLVRDTWIGVILNGRRYPRGLPGGAASAVLPASAPVAAEA